MDLIPMELLDRVGRVLKRGGEKYGEYNWRKGFAIHECANHAIRHLFLYLDGDESEDHLANAACNLAFMMHFEATRPDLVEELHERFPAARRLDTSDMLGVRHA